MDDDDTRLLRGLLAAVDGLCALPLSGQVGRVLLAAAAARGGCSDGEVAFNASLPVAAVRGGSPLCSTVAGTSRPCSRRRRTGTRLGPPIRGYASSAMPRAGVARSGTISRGLMSGSTLGICIPGLGLSPFLTMLLFELLSAYAISFRLSPRIYIVPAHHRCGSTMPF